MVDYTGAPLSGVEALIREVRELRAEVDRLRRGQARTVFFGTTYRIEVRGAGATATLWAVRQQDGNQVQIAP